MAITDKDLSEFASHFGGSYKLDNAKLVNGELTIPLPSGCNLSLHMSKKADRKFATSLVCLINNIRKFTKTTKDLTESANFAELVAGYFEGIKVLQEEYRSQDIAQEGTELLLITVSKVVETLRERYEVRQILHSHKECSTSHGIPCVFWRK